MKNISFLGIVFSLTVLPLTAQIDSTALLLIDIQEFYFPGGFSELHEPEKAAKNAAKILQVFRKNNLPVIHVQHKTKDQMDINVNVQPKSREKIIVKTEVNCFQDTNVKFYLDSIGTKSLVIAGMMTHMCVEGATRAASDFGYNVTLIQDACATKDLVFETDTIKAVDVHNSTLATLRSYAKIMNTKEFQKEFITESFN